MSTHKKIDIICCIAVVFALLVTALFMNAETLGIQAADKVMGYEKRLFDETKVHTVDIVIDDWDAFLTTCQSEEYSMCNLLIDGEAYTNVGIRGKGNTSLSTVSSMDSNRYSFKIEFDQYDNTKSYYGLDKLCLNNIIQDNTYMKDFLAYQLMEEFGVNAPLCSYVYITVNGEDWGLYLAVEGIEDGFLQRNYGSDYGELYKPDSLSMGGGRGNGKEFNMEDFDFSQPENLGNEMAEVMEFPSGNMQMPEGMTIPKGMDSQDTVESEEDGATSSKENNRGKINSGRDINTPDGDKNFGDGMGSNDVKLQYIDDNASSYSNIFDNAKTDVSEADEQRLIESLKALAEGDNIESVVDVEEVIRYFVVHNFVVNGDSYTGSMIHNYYLYEEDGKLSMIPWDYNLAYGTFQSNDANSAVNDPIDSPVSGGTTDRPMIHWIFESEEYTELYHQYLAEFIEKYYTNGKLAELIDYTAELIAPYVEKDPTKFCTNEEFETGVEAMREFCLLRAESVAGQLNGTIPSTSDGQAADGSNLVDASKLTLSDMGTMNNGMGGGKGGFGGDFSDRVNSGNRAESGIDFGNLDNFAGTEKNETKDDNRTNMPDMSEMPDVGNRGNRSETNNGNADMTQSEMGKVQFSGDASTGNVKGVSTETIVLLAASVACLLAGLLVAFKYKR